MTAPSKKLALVGFFSTIPLHLMLIAFFRDELFRAGVLRNYDGFGNRILSFKTGWQLGVNYTFRAIRLTYYAVALLFSLVTHVLFH
jgi:hypothetical protein